MGDVPADLKYTLTIQRVFKKIAATGESIKTRDGWSVVGLKFGPNATVKKRRNEPKFWNCIFSSFVYGHGRNETEITESAALKITN
jgi:hypothetical protein